MRYAVYSCLVIVCCTVYGAVGDRVDPNTVIAYVEDKPVFYGDIRIDEVASKVYSREEIDSLEFRRLLTFMQNLAVDRKIEEYAIQVDDEEVDAEIERRFKHLTVEQSDSIIQSGRMLYQALIKWQENPENEKEIYESLLATTRISRTDWANYRQFFDTPEKLKKLAIPKSLGDMKANTKPSAVKDLQYRKLMNTVVGEVVVEPNQVHTEFITNYKKQYPDLEVEDVYEEIETKLLQRKIEREFNKWYLEQLKKMQINILDKHFENMLAYKYPDIFSHSEK